jgi:hypothetical protein
MMARIRRQGYILCIVGLYWHTQRAGHILMEVEVELEVEVEVEVGAKVQVQVQVMQKLGQVVVQVVPPEGVPISPGIRTGHISTRIITSLHTVSMFSSHSLISGRKKSGPQSSTQPRIF